MCREQGYALGRLGYKAAQAQSGVSRNGRDPLRLPHTHAQLLLLVFLHLRESEESVAI